MADSLSSRAFAVGNCADFVIVADKKHQSRRA
jgi:hypothetical protein